MENIRFVPASLEIFYEEIYDSNKKIFQEEYNNLSEYENNDIEEWLKKVKAKGYAQDSDKVLLTLLIELHKKVDRIENILKKNEQKHIQLQHSSRVIGINFDYIKTNDYDFLEKKIYYARIVMPTFPKREIPIFLIGKNSNIAKINLISQKNLEDWNSFIMAKEREQIREMKRGF